MWRLWVSLLIICIACTMFSTDYFKNEHFTINDYYDRYLNDIGVPADFYSQTRYATGFKKIEMNDRFFVDVLSKASKPSSIDGLEKVQGAIQPRGLIERANELLVSVLNRALPSGESKIFAVAHSHITNATAYKDINLEKSSKFTNMWLIESEHIVHRDGKVYGALLAVKTLHKPNNTVLVSANLKGFILEDRIDSYQPYNLSSWDGNNQAFMKDKTFLRDKKYEHEYICKYIADLEKFRGIKTHNTPDCSDIY